VAAYLCKVSVERIGGPDRIFVIDETFVTSPTPSRSMRGRQSRNSKTCVLGALELDRESRKCTGRGFLRVVNNHRCDTIEHIIRTAVKPDAEIWTDEWVSYKWLGEADSGYRHHDVNHSGGQVVDAAGRGSSSVEGLFRRTKRMLRRHQIKLPRRGDYGLLMAEFLWRHMCIGEASGLPQRKWQQAAFWRLIACLGLSDAEKTSVGRHENAEGEVEPHELFRCDTGLAEIFSGLVPSIVESGKPSAVQLTPSEVFTAVMPKLSGDTLPDAEVEAARDAVAMIFLGDPTIDEGPVPSGPGPGRPRERGRGGLRGGRLWRGRGRSAFGQSSGLSVSIVAASSHPELPQEAAPLASSSTSLAVLPGGPPDGSGGVPLCDAVLQERVGECQRPHVYGMCRRYMYMGSRQSASGPF
jgi:hypothetical protein